MKTLATLDVGDGCEATIFEREDGSTWWSGLSMMLTPPPEPMVAWVPAGTVLAGELPPGSVSVEVRGAGEPLGTVMAGGRFMVLVAGEHRHHQVFLLFRDEHGGVVAPAFREELKREALDAHDVACPACGDHEWDRAEWAIETNDGRERRRAVLCHTCGHVAMGVEIVDPRPARDERELEVERDPLSTDPTAAEVVDVAAFPVYTLEGPELAAPSFQGASWTDGGLSSITLGAQLGEMSVEITSTIAVGGRALAEELARAQLERYLLRHRPVEHDPDHDVTGLRTAETQRRLWAGLARAPARTVSLRLGDEAIEAELVEHGGAWAATAGSVTVKARNVAPEDVALRLLRPGDELASACGP